MKVNQGEPALTWGLGFSYFGQRLQNTKDEQPLCPISFSTFKLVFGHVKSDVNRAPKLRYLMVPSRFTYLLGTPQASPSPPNIKYRVEPLPIFSTTTSSSPENFKVPQQGK